MTDAAGHIRVAARSDADPVEQLRGGTGVSLVMMIGPTLDATRTAMARAAVPAVAMERAPATRINAVIFGTGSDRVAIDWAVAYLHRSPAVTGQILEIS